MKKKARLILEFKEDTPVEYIDFLWRNYKSLRFVKDAYVEYVEVDEK